MTQLVDAAARATLDEFPGGPFSVPQVDAAAAQIRATCGWHIAPTATRTFTVDSDGSTVLMLPTLRLVAVTAVRDVTGDTPTAIDGWRKATAGMLVRRSRWPCGVAAVEVDVVHGYEQCPEALIPVIAERCQLFRRDGSIRQESLGSRSASFGIAEASPSTEMLARYKLPDSP